MNFNGLMIKEKKNIKACTSEDYNFIFDKNTGFFARWGKTKEDDPIYAPSPELIDLEISAGGPCKGKCDFCYKSNGGNDLTHNMSFDTFKSIIDAFDSNLMQIAFGIMDCHTNKDMFKMMRYARSKGIIPNYTTHGLDVTDSVAELTSRLCGAVAVSVVNKQKTYNTVKKFNDYGMTQVNIHLVIYEERMNYVYEILNDIKNDPRLTKLNAVVFLGLKNKGNAKTGFTPCSQESYIKLIQYCFDNNIRFGFDSCSAPKFEQSVLQMDMDENKKQSLLSMSEKCESGIFSFYINCKGIGFPCSFCEDIETGINLSNCNNFKDNIWNSDWMNIWRQKLLKNCRNCPVYNI